MKKSQHIGSNFDNFLADEGLLDEVRAVATKRVIAMLIQREMDAQQITKTAMAQRMHTSRTVLNRLLDESDLSLTLATLMSAASALGKRVKISLVSA